jgi:hypothetical protein
VKQRQPLSHAQKARSDLKASDGVTNAQRAQRGDLTLRMRDKGGNELKKLRGDLGKSKLGFTKVGVGLMSRSNDRDASSANKIDRKFQP